MNLNHLFRAFKHQAGFSLVEILVAVAILGIGSVGVMRVSSNSADAQIDAVANLKYLQLKNDLLVFFNNKENCRATLQGMVLESDKVKRLPTQLDAIDYGKTSLNSVSLIYRKFDPAAPQASAGQPAAPAVTQIPDPIPGNLKGVFAPGNVDTLIDENMKDGPEFTQDPLKDRYVRIRNIELILPSHDHANASFNYDGLNEIKSMPAQIVVQGYRKTAMNKIRAFTSMKFDLNIRINSVNGEVVDCQKPHYVDSSGLARAPERFVYDSSQVGTPVGDHNFNLVPVFTEPISIPGEFQICTMSGYLTMPEQTGMLWTARAGISMCRVIPSGSPPLVGWDFQMAHSVSRTRCQVRCI